MYLPKFKNEQWMTDHEKSAVYNLTDTCFPSFNVSDLLRYAPHALDDVLLDYGDITGSIAFKQAVLSLYQKGGIDNITTTTGCSSANALVMFALLRPKDHVIAFMPGYEQFVYLPKTLGCTVSVVALKEENGWQPDIEDIKAALRPNTRMILLNYPNNPTGIPYSETLLQNIIALCEKHRIYILSDEVYKPTSLVSLSDRSDMAISNASLSKVYGLAGLRLGWIKARKEMIDTLNLYRDYGFICASKISERLGTVALKHAREIEKRNEDILAKNREIVNTWLAKEKRCRIALHHDSSLSLLQYDIDLDSRTLAEDMLAKYGVFFVPGYCFEKEGYLRLSLTCDSIALQTGLSLLSNYMDAY